MDPSAPEREDFPTGTAVLSVLLDAAHNGPLSYERVVEVYSEAPARIYGLASRKARLAPGADADLVLVDHGARSTVSDEDVVSRAGWSPFSGRTLIGRTVQTFLRGSMRRWPDRRAARRSAFDLELGVVGSRFVHLDHVCAAAGVHRLLGVELTDGERELLRAGEIVAVGVACDRCSWERRLLLRLIAR